LVLRGIPRGVQDVPGDGAVRDAVVRRVAPPHGAGGGGPPVRDADARAPEKKSEGLTLDRAVRLLRSVLTEPELTVAAAIALVDYHARRNKVAKASHDKAWHAKHEGVKYLLL
jgi:hypothetical protein